MYCHNMKVGKTEVTQWLLLAFQEVKKWPYPNEGESIDTTEMHAANRYEQTAKLGEVIKFARAINNRD